MKKPELLERIDTLNYTQPIAIKIFCPLFLTATTAMQPRLRRYVVAIESDFVFVVFPIRMKSEEVEHVISCLMEHAQDGEII